MECLAVGRDVTAGTGTAPLAGTAPCAGCGSALAPGADWCWLCHRPVGGPAAAVLGSTTEPGDPVPVRPRWWRADLHPGASVALGAVLVAVLVPLLGALLTFGAAAGGAGTDVSTGVLGTGNRVDMSQLDRPPGP